MKIIEPKYEILTDISEGGIRRCSRLSALPGSAARARIRSRRMGSLQKKLVGFLVKQGHEAMLEHSQLSVLFTCDRGIANELVRHRIASFCAGVRGTATTRRISLAES